MTEQAKSLDFTGVFLEEQELSRIVEEETPMESLT
jgi:hypothetical protein